MTPAELERWQTKQIAALVAAGVNVLDAQNAVKRALAKLPPGADPNTYVPRDVPSEDLSSKAVLDDLRSWWYEKSDPRYARLLDAKGVE